ncbi:MAG: cell division protein FtsZ [Chakrabartia sp.]
MTIEFMAPEVEELKPRISVIGCGGAGGNAVANMIANQVQGVDFIVANTDAQALNSSSAERRIQLGLKITQGLGAGSRPEIGRAAAEEAIDQIERALEGSHMCFIAAGMGGGTGTGAAPVIAKAARDRGILTVGVVTKPFSFEGNRRMKSADAGIAELQKHVDTLIVIPNQNLFLIANPQTTFKEAFAMADEVLQQGVRGITDLMVMPGLINLDFADVRTVMSEMGKAMMGTGEAEGDNRAIEAAEKAIANPLLDGVSMKGAKGVIVSITGGEDMRLMEVDEAASHIKELVDPDANIIWGSAFNDSLNGKIRVSVVATGIETGAAVEPRPAQVFSLHAGRKMEEPRVEPAPSFEPVAPQPVAETPFDAAPAAPEEDALDLGAEAARLPDEADELILSSPEAGASDDADELVLGSDSFVEPTASNPLPAAEQTPAGQEPPSWFSQEAAPEPAPAQPAPRPAAAGGTLFERMSNIARGAAKADDAAKGDPLDIPRFLNRQNNQ